MSTINNLDRDTPPLVSIVIATYNRSSSLDKYCISGISSLNYPNHEVIIVDDFSTDNTASFLKAYQNKQNNFTVLRNKKNSGAAFSRNRGINYAKGDFIVLIDDDVSLLSDSLDNLVEAFNENQEVMAIWGCVLECNESKKCTTKSFGSGSFWALRKEAFNGFRFDTNMRYFGTPACDEHEFARRLKRNGHKFMQLETAKALHYHAPADNRKRRGIGGDLNYLYENTKTGSILEYYLSLVKGCLLSVKFIITGKKEKLNISPKYKYKQLLLTPEHLTFFVKNGRLDTAFKWLYYVTIDIPLKAKTKVILETIAQRFRVT